MTDAHHVARVCPFGATRPTEGVDRVRVGGGFDVTTDRHPLERGDPVDWTEILRHSSAVARLESNMDFGAAPV